MEPFRSSRTICSIRRDYKVLGKKPKHKEVTKMLRLTMFALLLAVACAAAAGCQSTGGGGYPSSGGYPSGGCTGCGKDHS